MDSRLDKLSKTKEHAFVVKSLFHSSILIQYGYEIFHVWFFAVDNLSCTVVSTLFNLCRSSDGRGTSKPLGNCNLAVAGFLHVRKFQTVHSVCSSFTRFSGA